MAERRMFSKTIIECDKFIDMPLSSQCLYFHLSMNADDDGFVDSPKKIKRSIGCTDDDLKILVSKSRKLEFIVLLIFAFIDYRKYYYYSIFID